MREGNVFTFLSVHQGIPSLWSFRLPWQEYSTPARTVVPPPPPYRPSIVVVLERYALCVHFLIFHQIVSYLTHVFFVQIRTNVPVEAHVQMWITQRVRTLSVDLSAHALQDMLSMTWLDTVKVTNLRSLREKLKAGDVVAKSSIFFPDVDECAVTPSVCGTQFICTNTDGSHTCACEQGYEMEQGSCAGESVN